MRKKIIWSLFDSETAITQELNSENYTVISIGLPSSSAISDNFVKMDLSRKSCLKKLEKLPAPDIIFSSPPCESWVSLSIGSVQFYERNYNEYNMYWQKNFKSNNFAKRHRESRLLGQRCAYFTSAIIKKFKPESWFIENGSSSLIFKYLNRFHGLEGFLNATNYYCYSDDFGQKPTIFFSNKKLTLRNYKVKHNKILISPSKFHVDKERATGEWERLGFSSPTAFIKSKYDYKETYCDRSKVPLELYVDILEQLNGNGQQVMF